jgi:hypothetical protein
MYIDGCATFRLPQLLKDFLHIACLVTIDPYVELKINNSAKYSRWLAIIRSSPKDGTT